MKQVQMKSSLLLLLAALIWGVAFVAQRMGMDYMGPFAFSASRFLLGGVVLIPVVLFLRKRSNAAQHPDAAQIRRNTIIGGILCGLVMCVGANLQQFSLLYTSVGKAGFLTALYIIFVPLIGLFMGKKAGLKLWLSVAIAVFGLYLLCMTDSLILSKGDTIAFVCAVVFALHILVIDRYVALADGVMMSCIQFLVAGVVSLVPMFIFETAPTVQALVDGCIPILYTGVLSCGVAYTLQIVGQKNMNPTVASLILSLEAVIAVIAAWLILSQSMTSREILGAVLMFAAILIAQLPEKQGTEQAPPEQLQEGETSS